MTERKIHTIARATISLGISIVVLFQLQHVFRVCEHRRFLDVESELNELRTARNRMQEGIVHLDIASGQLVKNQAQAPARIHVTNDTSASPVQEASSTTPEVAKSGANSLERHDEYSPTETSLTTSSSSRELSHLVDDSVPVKLTATGQIDWDSYDHVYYYHTRKAG